jgi:hypothetical protein
LKWKSFFERALERLLSCPFKKDWNEKRENGLLKKPKPVAAKN